MAKHASFDRGCSNAINDAFAGILALNFKKIMNGSKVIPVSSYSKYINLLYEDFERNGHSLGKCQ